VCFEFLYSKKLALISPTSGGRSVGIACSRTQATEFSLVFIYGETCLIDALNNVLFFYNMCSHITRLNVEYDFYL
jgi:hypothetical protein